MTLCTWPISLATRTRRSPWMCTATCSHEPVTPKRTGPGSMPTSGTSSAPAQTPSARPTQLLSPAAPAPTIGAVPSSNTNPLPFAVREALIQASGTVFYWKRGLIQLFVSAGVPEPAVTRYQDEVKYVIARSILADLDGRGAAGRRVQWQIVENMLGLTGPADRDANPEEAKSALKTLREAVGQRPGASADNDDAEARGRKNRAGLERQARERQSKAI